MKNILTTRSVNKILVPVDFSDLSNHTVNYAAAFAEVINAGLILFHVNGLVASMAGEPAVAFDYRSVSQDIFSELEKLKDSVKASFNLHNIKALSKPGFVIDEIQEEAITDDIDLIIIGTTKNTSAHAEGITSEVISKAQRPVLTIPSAVLFFIPKKIAFISELNLNEIDAIVQTTDLVKSFKSSLIILHPITSDELVLNDFKSELYRRINSDDITFVSYSHGMIPDSLNSLVAEHSIDWISTIVKKSNFFSEFFHPVQSKHIAMHSNIPVLAFHF